MTIEQTEQRRKWARLIAKAQKDFNDLHTSGDRVVNQYRIEQRTSVQQDKYNILYANTETIKPSLYSQTPKTEVQQRTKDQSSPIARGASMLLEQTLDYGIKEQDFDDVMNSVVEDFLLPGMGVAWVRYVPTMQDMVDSEGNPVLGGEDGKTPQQEVVYEHISYDYVYYKDFLCSTCRRWSENWWVAKRVYMTKEEVAKNPRFGPDIANKISFDSATESKQQHETIEENQAEVWEIWDKRTKKVRWYCPSYDEDVMAEADDFLRLRDFFPCPKPIRAVTTNNKFVPRPFYSQYQAQADELNDLTHRIRRLVDCLRLVGIYDASVPELKNLLTGTGNKMVPVDNWAMMAEKGGIKGTVDYVPIAEVATVLMQLYDARDRVKNEIYEITGWSDIIRGVSKASETLGAQQIKADWASSRLKLMQKEVQRFIRDLLRIAGEIVSEHFQDSTLFLMSGIEFGDDPQKADQLAKLFKQVVQILKDDKDRCALINIETDSTIMPDEVNDRKERMDFLSAAGAYLQQAVPAIQTEPRLAGLLGEILMFTVRSFRAARPLEAAFEQFTQSMQQGGPTPPQQKGGQGGSDPAATQAKVQTDMAKTQVQQQKVQNDAELGQAELQQEAEATAAQIDLERTKEQNRHMEKMQELALRQREVAVKEAELGIEAHVAGADINLREQQQANDSMHASADRQAEQENRQADRMLERESMAADRAESQNSENNGA